MTKANDIRIGNYVKETLFTNRVAQITSIAKNRVHLKYEFSRASVSIKDIEPIPLTEEILLKCGFGKWLGLYSQNTFTLSTNNHIEYEHTQTSVKIKYLHELHNLYFAIKKEELTIQL